MCVCFPFQDALSGASGGDRSKSQVKKFALFSGHDTVIAPLLAALGAYDCKWPPYASHVAFELWSKPVDGEEDGHGSGDGGNNGRARQRQRLLRNTDNNRGKSNSSKEHTQGEGYRATVKQQQLEESLLADGPALSPLVDRRVRGGNDKVETMRLLGDGNADAGQVPAWEAEEGEATGERRQRRDTEEDYDDVFVRVTFNGKAVTHRITDCRTQDGEG